MVIFDVDPDVEFTVSETVLPGWFASSPTSVDKIKGDDPDGG